SLVVRQDLTEDGPDLGAPLLLVHRDSLSVEIPRAADTIVDAEREADGGMTLRFRVPGAPQWIMAEYRVHAGGWLWLHRQNVAEEASADSLRLAPSGE